MEEGSKIQTVGRPVFGLACHLTLIAARPSLSAPGAVPTARKMKEHDDE
jgi:hypothetical protein